MERRLAAVLIADVVGYSRLMEIDEVGTLEALKAIRRDVFDTKIAEHHGRLVKLMGDGVLVEFASVVQAVNCAIEVQHGVAERNADLPQDRCVQFRVGINLGDIIAEDDDIYGDGVNIAARLESLSEPGGICLSRAARDQVRDKIDIALEDLGEVEVKNIYRPVRVFRIAPTKGAVPAARADGPSLPLPDKPSIVVLPFDNMSGDPEQEYFSDGMVEEITTALCRVRSLFVIARNSAFAYKGRAVDVKQVSRELGVRYLVEGSVRKAGDRIRLTAQLIDAIDRSHIWAERYDGVLEDVFVLQDRLTESIVGAIEPQLRTAEIVRSRRKPPEDLNAYDCFLRALPHVHAMTAEGNREATRLLDTALELDSGYGSAMALQSWCYALRPAQGWVVSAEQEVASALKLAQSAVDVAGQDPEVLWLSGYTQAYFGETLDTGLSLIARALELDPNAAQAWAFSGWVNTYKGRADMAVEHFERAMRLSPIDPAAYRTRAGMAFAYFFLHRFDGAIDLARMALQENPRFSPTHRVLVASLGQAGRVAEAQPVIRSLLDLVPGLTIDRFMKETRFRYPAYSDLMIDGLRKAGLPE